MSVERTPAERIFAVIVTYQPGDVSLLLSQFASQCTEVIVVDNSEQTPKELIEQCQANDATLVALHRNIGIAAAQNIGIKRALEQGADAVILSDQDSVPGPTMVADLAAHLGPGVGAVGPVPFDGDEPLVYTDHRWGPKRPAALPGNDADTSEPIEASFLLASGCLIPADVLREVGPMPAEYFIDHVDLAWCMHARSYGYRLLAIPSVRLTHSLGDSGVKIAGRNRTIHIHSPLRNYYLTRNTIELMRNPDLPLPWRIRYGYWIARFAAFTVLTQPERAKRARMITRGLCDGVRRRMGKFAEK